MHFNWNFDNEQAQISKARKVRKSPFSNFRRFWWKCDRTVVSYHNSQNSENRKAFQFTTSIYIDKVLYSIKINNYKQLISISNSLESNIKTKTKLCANKMTMAWRDTVAFKMRTCIYKIRKLFSRANYFCIWNGRRKFDSIYTVYHLFIYDLRVSPQSYSSINTRIVIIKVWNFSRNVLIHNYQ